jgi:ribonuclease HI
VSAPYVLHSDGAARGNPGPAAIGAVLFAPGRLEPVAVVSEAIGRATNNEAEYRALLAGLEAALAAGVTHLLVRLDSELLVQQATGAYRVKAANLKPYFEQLRRLMIRFASIAFEHVPRERNSIADDLANAALDRG